MKVILRAVFLAATLGVGAALTGCLPHDTLGGAAEKGHT
jgi:hypothetical protein